MSEQTRSEGTSKAPLYALLFTVVAWIGLMTFGGTAFAQTTGSTSNDSAGAGSAATGDAAATGNSTGTAAAQNGGGSGLSFTDQNVTVTNTGSATANTGGNTATGNESDNDADADQDASSDGGDASVVSNSGDARNSSNGSASITTGNATAVGNQSWTEILQGANTAGGDGLSFIDQDAIVTNDGDAEAETGDNDATGNDSDNEAELEQELDPGETGEIISNSGDASNDSDGSADIDTGDADATGNEARTGIEQWATAALGNGNGGIVDIEQEADVDNDGDAEADTGDNDATGNDSDNESEVEQEPDSIRGPPGDEVVLSNIGSATNESDGTAEISTGDASATGNRSDVTITQEATGAVEGLVFIDQDADVENDGDAEAETGENDATGNNSDNEAEVEQEAEIDEDDGGDLELGEAVFSNIAESANRSDGTARIATGDALAVGNDSAESTDIVQSADVAIADDGFAFVDQEADVENDGDAEAETGDNDATGNNSDNDADVDQDIEVSEENGGDLEADETVISNIGSAVNESDGTAEISTGSAEATGNHSTDSITQSANVAIEDDGFAFVDQVADVDNDGDAEAETGENDATGNNSDNDADVDQDIEVSEEDGGDLELGDAVLSNIGEAANTSDGSASITTGEACANGNWSATDIAQEADVAIGADGFTFIDQVAEVENDGDADADSGDNDATGNNSDNDSDLEQELEVSEENGGELEAEDTVLSNIGAATNDSNGSADITTGDAIACGNVATDSISQAAAFANDDDGFAFFDQVADIDNDGDADAETGENDATGNNSDNDADNFEQSIEASEEDGGDLEFSEFVSSNIGEAANTSDGSASIDTGDATASGNYTESNIAQDAAFANDGDGFAFIDQEADIENDGEGEAETGDNDATGNDSDNDAEDFDQEIEVSEENGGDLELEGDSVLSNIGDARNESDGSADISTGDAIAYGNYSTGSNVDQSAAVAIGDDGFADIEQDADIENDGDADAETGENDATGNNSDNDAEDFDQDVEVTEEDGGDLEGNGLVASNNGESSNWSDGSADITTGNATAYGNAANTEINMAADVAIEDDGFTLLDQDADVDNDGDAEADTGDNDATGNNSDNDADLDQEVEVEEEDGGDLELDEAVLVNSGDNINSSDGSANVDTGDADAIGNYSATGVALAALVEGSDLDLVDQAIEIENDGDAEANTGDNDVVGNDSENESETEQETELDEDGAGDLEVDDLVLSNSAETANESDGSGSATTGDASAQGNVAVNSACSGLNTEVDCPEVSLPPLPPPPCPCKIHDEEEVPEVPEVPEQAEVPGEELPVTGGPLAAQAALGLLLVALGRSLRRRSQTAA